MPLETPRLDDRTFEDLVREAKRRIPLYTPEWTDHNISDPGIAMLELFSWLMDIVLYRLNRVPDRIYVKFMELLGMKLRDPEPAHTDVTFWLTAPQETEYTIPVGTEIATTRTENDPSVIFSTISPFTIHVPSLNTVMTSKPPQKEGEKRGYVMQNLKRLEVGFDGFPAFSTPPTAGDAIYFGFDQDMSMHIVGLNFNVDLAGGAGVDPTQPPYVWEVLSSVTPLDWSPCELDKDETKALNQPGVLSLHLPKMVQGRIEDRTAFWLRVRLIQPSKGIPQYRLPPTIRQLQVASWGCTTPGTHSSRIVGELLGRSDGTPGQKFATQYKPVLPREKGETVLVRISNDREELWTEVPDFATSSPTDRHFTLDGGTGEVKFGPALNQRDGSVKRYGAIPPQGAFIVFTLYRYGGGTEGNLQAKALNVLKTGLPFINRVANRKLAFGGLNAENLEDAKHRVPGLLRSISRAVTAGDCEYLAMQAAPGRIHRVFALQPPNVNTGEIKVLIVPRVNEVNGYITPDELALGDDVRTIVQHYLDERRLISSRLDVLPPAYYWVSTRVKLRLHEFADVDRVKLLAETRLYTYLNPITGGSDGKGWTFGRDLVMSDVISALQTISGIESVLSVDLFPITWDSDGKAQRGDPTQEIKLVAHGVIASYRHDIRTEE